MPKDKMNTYQKIIPAARTEFLEKGFEQASMRSIAARAGMSAAGLYRHFTDKEALFAALIEPALESCRQWYQSHKAKDYELLEKNDLDAMWENGADARMVREVIYPHYEEFKLLVCCSQGTKYADFLHELVMLEQRETIAFMEEAKKRGIPVKEISPKEMHLLMSAYVTAIFEVIVHDFTLEEAEHYMKTLQDFFCPGWRVVLGL